MGETSKLVFKIIGFILLAFVVIKGTTWFYRWYSAPIEGKIEKREKTESGDYRVYSYDHFHDLYEKIQSYDEQIEHQKKLLEQTENDKEKRRIRRNISGLKSQRSRAVHKYNSDAKKEKTRGKFKPEDLPQKIER